jgi:hypothetical protein
MRRLIILALLLLSFSPSSTFAQSAEQCTPNVKTDPVNLTFVNYTSRSVTVYWVDSNCMETSYKTLAAGESYVQPTFVGHVWRVRDTALLSTKIIEFAAQDTHDIVVPVGSFAPLNDKLGCTPNVKTDAITLTFVNYTSRPVGVYWSGFDCTEKLYQQLAPGQSFDQPTYLGHVWFVRDDDNKAVLTQFVATDATTTHVLIGQTAVTPAATCSSNSATAVTYTFANLTSRKVDVYWVDQNCKEKFYQSLAAGASYDQGTFDGHVWRLYDSESKTLLNQITVTTPTK